MTQILFRGGSVLDAAAGVLLEGHDVLVEGDRIKEVSDRSIRATNAAVIQLHGRVLMPGLIDAHTHMFNTPKPGMSREASDIIAIQHLQFGSASGLYRHSRYEHPW